MNESEQASCGIARLDRAVHARNAHRAFEAAYDLASRGNLAEDERIALQEAPLILWLQGHERGDERLKRDGQDLSRAMGAIMPVSKELASGS